MDSNNIDGSKQRFYKTLKGTFSREPYLDLVKNRNQRAWLTRIRVSAHHLQIEVGRWSRPPIPPSERLCRYCSDGCIIDTEYHFLHDCATLSLRRNCFLPCLIQLYLNSHKCHVYTKSLLFYALLILRLQNWQINSQVFFLKLGAKLMKGLQSKTLQIALQLLIKTKTNANASFVSAKFWTA